MTYDENYTNVIMFWIKIRNRIMIQRNKGRDALILFLEIIKIELSDFWLRTTELFFPLFQDGHTLARCQKRYRIVK